MFGIKQFKLLKNLDAFDYDIYSDGESFIINFLDGSIILAETITDLLDYFDIEDRNEVIEEIKESYKNS